MNSKLAIAILPGDCATVNGNDVATCGADVTVMLDCEVLMTRAAVLIMTRAAVLIMMLCVPASASSGLRLIVHSVLNDLKEAEITDANA